VGRAGRRRHREGVPLSGRALSLRGHARARHRGELRYTGDPETVDAAIEAFRARGGELGWGATDTVNRWRETEVATSRAADEALLRAVAEEFGLEFVDTQYAYHLKSPGVSKGGALREVAETLDYAPAEFVAIGDSANDVSMFEVVDESYAVANAVDAAKEAASHVLEEGYVDGTLTALEAIQKGTTE